MKVKFLQDYVGRETAMKQYKTGDTEIIGQQAAIELIQAGIVEEVAIFEPLPDFDDEAKLSKPKRKVKDESDKQ